MEALEGASMQQDLGFPALLNASAKGTSRIPHVQKGRPKLHIGAIFQCSITIPMCNLERPFCTWGVAF